ncbi:hypothetical protein GC176_20515 [bacterium]|nr:hypothetical protein [bacterium]
MESKYRTDADRKKAAVEATMRHTEKLRQMAIEHKNEHPCVDCGEDDPIVLQFDHRDPKEKSFTIGCATSRGGVSFARLQTEMDKCDIRCANCHIKKTRRENEHRVHARSEGREDNRWLKRDRKHNDDQRSNLRVSA